MTEPGPDLEKAFAELREREQQLTAVYDRHVEAHARTMRRMVLLFAVATLLLAAGLIVQLMRLFTVCP